MREAADQPIITLAFAIGGALAYIVYKIITEAERSAIFKKYSVLLDIIIGLYIGLSFLAISHFLFNGKLKYYMPIGYVMGMILANMFLERPIEILVKLIKKGVKIIMAKIKEFFTKMWNKISKTAQSIFKGGKKDEQNNDNNKA